MYSNTRRTLGWASAIALILTVTSGRAAEPHFANVPPGDEIEVLDPNADPLGRPAVELHRGKDGQLQVVVPPAVLVHKYYYNGDRSFQAQMLPGGPTILVVNHPRSGERCYIEANLLPGAPRVTYTGSAIVYDYGEHGMTLKFPILGQPKIEYRSGLPLHKKIGNLVHAEALQEHASAVKQQAELVAANTQDAVTKLGIDTSNAVKDVFLPVQHLIRVLPFGARLTDPDQQRIRAEEIAEHKRQKEFERFQKQQWRSELTLPTNR